MADEQLKALGQARVGGAALRQRRNVHRVHRDKGRLDELFFHLLVKHLVQGVAPGGVGGGGQLDADGLGRGHGLFIGGDGHEVKAGVLFHRLVHRQAGPAGGQVKRLPLPGELIAAQQLFGGGGEQVLEQVHHAVEVGVGLVELDGRELGVVLGVHALVAEDAPKLVHAVQPAHDQPLERQLGGNAHVHVDVQRVVVGDERPRRGAAGDGVEHRGLDFHKAAGVQEIAHELDKARTHDERLLDLRVDDEVDIALAVAGFAVGQAVELFRQRLQALGQQRDAGHTDAELAHAGAEHLALAADHVADIQLFEGGVGFLAQHVALGKDLDIAAFVAQVGKAGLAHHALGHHAPGQADGLAGLALGGQVLELLLQSGGKIGLVILGDGIRVAPGGLQVGQLLAAHLPLGRDVDGVLVGHWDSSFLR